MVHVYGQFDGGMAVETGQLNQGLGFIDGAPQKLLDELRSCLQRASSVGFEAVKRRAPCLAKCPGASCDSGKY